MGVEAGVIVKIDSGYRLNGANTVSDLPEHLADFAVFKLATWPATIEIELIVKAAQAVFGSMCITDKNGQ